MTDSTPTCPKCGDVMECKKIPEIGSPHVGWCPAHGMSYVECIPPPDD